MNNLSNLHCEVCRADAPLLTDNQLAVLMLQIPEWEVYTDDNISQLERTYHFNDFAKGMAFAQKVADLAETQDHHPTMLIEWGKVTVTWWTHKINGLHRNDLICAAKTDLIKHR